MISGAHAIIYSKDAEADRRFLLEVLKLPHVDAGQGWLIFALPPAEVAVHPGEENDRHELYLMCEDIEHVARTLMREGLACSARHEERWGVLMQLTLPGGGNLGIYQPRHPRPEPNARPDPSSRPEPNATPDPSSTSSRPDPSSRPDASARRRRHARPGKKSRGAPKQR